MLFENDKHLIPIDHIESLSRRPGKLSLNMKSGREISFTEDKEIDQITNLFQKFHSLPSCYDSCDCEEPCDKESTLESEE